MAKKTHKFDEVISRILVELDVEQAEYQKLYRKVNGRTDTLAKHIHQRMVDLCERIRQELLMAERK